MLVAGPDVDASGGWEHAVALAEKQRLPVWATPATGGSRIGFPERHPNFAGILPPAIAAISETLKEHDLVLVAGSSVFPYYPYIPGPLLGPETSLVAITCDPCRGRAGADGRRNRRRRGARPADVGRPGWRSRTPGAPERAPSPASRHPITR